MKLERPEANDFVIKKIPGFEGKILSRNSLFPEITKKKFLADTLTKISEIIFAYSCVSEHSMQKLTFY